MSSLGVVGAITGVIVAHILNERRNESSIKRDEEKDLRDRRLEIYRNLMVVLFRIEDQIFQPDYKLILDLGEDGRKHIASIPKEGIDGIISERKRLLWSDSIKKVSESRRELMDLVADLSILDAGDAYTAALKCSYTVRECIKDMVVAEFRTTSPRGRVKSARQRFADVVLEIRYSGELSQMTAARLRYWQDDLIQLEPPSQREWKRVLPPWWHLFPADPDEPMPEGWGGKKPSPE
jgi:hypothetical protein